MNEMDQIELDSLDKPSNPTPNQDDVKPVALRTLFFKFASKKEKTVFSLGFLFAVVSGTLSPLSFIFYGTILDEVNSQEIDANRLRIFLLDIALFLLAASMFAFLERLCLGYFAGVSYSYL